jgi:uncharacterized protein
MERSRETAATIPTDPHPPPTPAGGGEGRIASLDILRGFALFGMILVHFHQKMRLEVGGLEDLIGWAVWMLVEQKAWGTFAFLFGAGFAIFLRRLEARGAPSTRIFLRRLAALAVFGIVAGVGFGFHILFEYACWGVLLLLVRRWSTRALLGAALFAAMVRPVVAEASAWWAWWTRTPLPPRPGQAWAQALEAATTQGSWFELVAARWQHFLATTPGDLRGLLPDGNFALFVLGLLAVRHRLFDEPLRHRRVLVTAMAFGAISWLVSWTVLRLLPEIGVPGAQWPLAAGLGILHDQWLCLTYIGAVVLLLARWPARVRTLAPVGRVGRMALTHYMLQAVVLDALSSGYGAALKLRPLHYAPAAIAFFAVQVAVSTAWLARFRYGPLEWIWRAATYGRFPALQPPAIAPTTSTGSSPDTTAGGSGVSGDSLERSSWQA